MHASPKRVQSRHVAASALVAAILVASVLSGCGGGGVSPSGSIAAPQPQPVQPQSQAAPAPAPEAAPAPAPVAQGVYITRTGSKYHRANCSYLRQSSIPIGLSEAQGSGYTPCSRCNP